MTADDVRPGAGRLPAALDRAAPPWLYLWEGEAARLDRRVAAWARAGAVGRVLRGAAMRTEQAAFDELAAVLEFPDWFGQNWDAVDDCLTDLAWLPGDAYVLVITDADQVLADEPDQRFGLFCSVLERAGEEWATPVARGEWWDRPAVPFHTVLHAAPGRGDALRARLDDRDAPPLEPGD